MPLDLGVCIEATGGSNVFQLLRTQPKGEFQGREGVGKTGCQFSKGRPAKGNGALIYGHDFRQGIQLP